MTLLVVPFVLQGLALGYDELVFHRRRGLPRWERLGHPLDTLTVVLCFAWTLVCPPRAPHALAVFIALATLSSLFVTKDEPIHARLCSPEEQWLHAVSFVLHPTVLLCAAIAWRQGLRTLLAIELALTLGFGIAQLLAWNWRRPFIAR